QFSWPEWIYRTQEVQQCELPEHLRCRSQGSQ
ncbi:hypothetical protein GBAR_LOCUS21139, partial [Geodia barretti]